MFGVLFSPAGAVLISPAEKIGTRNLPDAQALDLGCVWRVMSGRQKRIACAMTAETFPWRLACAG
jgi:hypothetical protein